MSIPETRRYPDEGLNPDAYPVNAHASHETEQTQAQEARTACRTTTVAVARPDNPVAVAVPKTSSRENSTEPVDGQEETDRRQPRNRHERKQQEAALREDIDRDDPLGPEQSHPKKININDFCLVLLIGPAGSGKSTFAKKHFAKDEILASDDFREMLTGNRHDQECSAEAFELLHHALDLRLKRRRLCVVDATNLMDEHRKKMVDIAREHDARVTAIVFKLPLSDILLQNEERGEADPASVVPERDVRRQNGGFRKLDGSLKSQRVKGVRYLRSREQAEETIVERYPLREDKRNERGPFDVIGDVHGCHAELVTLLQQLGYRETESDSGTESDATTYRHPEGRRVVFVGDLNDRGPSSDSCLDLGMRMVEAGDALHVNGNHEDKLYRHLRGNKVQMNPSLQLTIDQIEARGPEFKQQVRQFLGNRPEHLWLEDGRLTVAHGGILERYQGRASGRVKAFCLYGMTNGEQDEWGLPVRLQWHREYRGKSTVVYGHTPVLEPEWSNHTINIDTGCCFGGKLTALRWPEKELVSVPALETYYTPPKPLEAPANDGTATVGPTVTIENLKAAGQEENTPNQQSKGRRGDPGKIESLKAALNPAPPRPAPAQSLDLQKFTGDQEIMTARGGVIRTKAKQNAGALETISRFSVDPRWLVYLPPTVSPSETSRLENWLERPEEVLNQYRQDGVRTVICEEKHMGSRAVAIVGRSRLAVNKYFGLTEDEDTANAGIIYTRTGRRFFDDPEREKYVLDALRRGMVGSGLWNILEADWVVLDCELMPWSLKAEGLFQKTYAPVAAAAMNTTQQTEELLIQAAKRGLEVVDLVEGQEQRMRAAREYEIAYRTYSQPTLTNQDIRIAPFHLLASDRAIYFNRTHHWHMQQAEALAEHGAATVQATKWLTADLDDPEQCQAAIDFWNELTAAGSEGMVVKPLEFLPRGTRDRIQPAVKVRGSRYLRLIYGPEYDLPGNINRMRRRSLHTKRNLAVNEFHLGIEGLERFVQGDTLERVHQCAFGVLSLETEETDPRL